MCCACLKLNDDIDILARVLVSPLIFDLFSCYDLVFGKSLLINTSHSIIKKALLYNQILNESA